MADPEAFHKTLTEQGQLLGRDQQVLSGVTQLLDSIAQQQAEQQAQLAQLVASVRGLIGQLQSMNITEPATSASVSTVMAAPSTPVFPVSKPDKFDGEPDKCRGFLLQCSVYFDNSPASSDQAKIAFIVLRLASKALEWATASWTQIYRLSYAQFLDGV